MRINALFLLLLLGVSFSLQAKVSDDCRSLMSDFLVKANKKENATLLKNHWSKSEKKRFLDQLNALELADEEVKLIVESLNMQTARVAPERVQKYLSYALTLNEKNRRLALLDLGELDGREINSKLVNKFIEHEKKIEATSLKRKFTGAQEARYHELYYGCRALSPNDVNKNAARDFKRFNLSLNLGTLGASYAFYNNDKEINAEWFGKLGYDIGITVLFSYVGGSIQTKATDTQIVKSLKSYFMGRVIGTTDLLIYDPIFNNERERAEARLAELKKDPHYKTEVERLLKIYEERGLYRQYKAKIIDTLRKLPDGMSLGLRGNSVDENGVDWNNLTQADLDRPEVQEVLVAASMAQMYHESKGEWIETGDAGLDRYTFNSIFYFVQIPKSIAQNFITYRMLCMGQDDPKLAFTKAVIFNVATSFAVNQVLYGYREKAINQ